MLPDSVVRFLEAGRYLLPDFVARHVYAAAAAAGPLGHGKTAASPADATLPIEQNDRQEEVLVRTWTHIEMAVLGRQQQERGRD